ncbi:MAG: DUF4446 family protein [Actinomycetes bacterium]
MPHLNFSSDTTQLLALVGAAAGVLALIVGLLAHLRFRRLRRAYSALQGGDDGASLLSVVRRQADDMARLRAEVTTAGRELGNARADLADAIRHVSVVRYDAFADMGGRLSFSAALLDDAGDGLVLTSINGRTETRSYAKGVKGGVSEHNLSPEEEQAIAFALRGSAAKAARGPAPATEDVSIQL